ncbi:MAG: FlgD immunoglobulin-like domain containing protein [Candidatus Eisenbacteria bacterium]
MGAAQHVWESSFAVAQVNGPVSDNFREEIAEPAPGGDADFQQASPLFVSVPGSVVAQEATAVFDDSRAESPYGLEITSNFFADDAAGNEDFVICQYVMKNTTGSTLNNMRAGMFQDVDFNNQYSLNSVNYDAARSLAYVTTPNTTSVYGLAVLNVEGAVAMRALKASTATPAEDFTDANKTAWMSGGFAQTTIGPDDIALMIATGNFSIPPGGEAKAAFALLCGSNLTDLRNNADAARALYQNVIDTTTDVGENGHAVLPVALGAPTPNPFGGITRLDYTLYSASPVQVDVLDASGRIVRQLVNEEQPKGMHTITWDGTDAHGSRLPSGVYFTRILADGREHTRKMQLIR